MKVFLSYAHENEALARRIADVLREAGLDVWDRRDILPGDNWAEKVSHALNESQAMVVLITPESLRSEWVRREIEYALGNKRYSERLLPVFVGPRENIPPDEIPWILERLQAIELTTPEEEEEGIRQIAEALCATS